MAATERGTYNFIYFFRNEVGYKVWYLRACGTIHVDRNWLNANLSENSIHCKYYEGSLVVIVVGVDKYKQEQNSKNVFRLSSSFLKTNVQ